MTLSLDTATLLLGCLGLLLAILYAQRQPDAFDLRHLIVDSKTGRVSLFKTGQLVALMTSTWILIHETRANNLTEWLFTAYMLAWTGANVAQKFLARDNGKKAE